MGVVQSKQRNNNQDYLNREVDFETMLSIRAIPSHSKIMRGETVSMTLMLEIVTNKLEGIERPPINLAMILDRSGSMSGGKITGAKEAVQKTILQLSPKDKAHLIIYDDKAKTVFTSNSVSNPNALVEKTQSVVTGGSTDMEMGMNHGFRVLMRARSRNIRSNRIFLFSDGQPNAGVRTDEGLGKIAAKMSAAGANITTFGIGDDYNESLMLRLANEGKGDYFFIDSPENITSLVQKGLDRMFTLIGTNTQMNVSGMNGVSITRIQGYGLPKFGAPIGDIKANEIRQIMIELEIPKEATTTTSDTLDILQWSIEITPISKGSHVYKRFGTASVGLTDDKAESVVMNREVEACNAMSHLNEVNGRIPGVLNILHQPDGMKMLEAAIKELSDATANLKTFHEPDKYRENPEMDMIGKLLERTEKVLDRLVKTKEGESSEMAMRDVTYLGYQTNLKCSGLM